MGIGKELTEIMYNIKPNMKKSILYLAMTMAALPAFCRCTPEMSDDKTYRPPVAEVEAPEPGMWASFESKYTRYSEGQKHAGQSNQKAVQTSWADTVWRNDRTHTQIVVWTNDEDFENLTYDVSRLSGPAGEISKDNITVRFAGYVTGHKVPSGCGTVDDTPVKIADALMDTPVKSVTADDPVKVWLTIDIPEETPAGVYDGVFTVAGGDTERELEISLTVADRVLPDVSEWGFHLDLWQFPYGLMNLCTPKVDFASEEYFALMEPFYRKLADAGQKAITTNIKSNCFYVPDSMVKWIKKSSGEWDFDYTDFDKFVSRMMEWGITKQISCFSLLGWNPSIQYYDEASGAKKTHQIVGIHADNPNGYTVVGSDEWSLIWTDFLNSFENHLKEKGWFDKAVLYMDENNHDDMKAVIDMIKSHNQDWKIGLAGSSLDAETEAKMYDYSIFLTRTSQKSTPVHTFYTSCSHVYPNCLTTPENSPAEMAWMGWHAAGNGYNGYLRWAYDNWRTGDPLDTRDGSVSGDNHMLYHLNRTSNANAVVTSMRFELMREGIQDYEKIRILNDSNVNAAASNFVTPASTDTKVDAAALVSRGERAIAVASMK